MSEQDQNPQTAEKDILTKCAEGFWGGIANLMSKISTHEEYQQTHSIFHSETFTSGHGLPPKVVDTTKAHGDKKNSHAK